MNTDSRAAILTAVYGLIGALLAAGLNWLAGAGHSLILPVYASLLGALGAAAIDYLHQLAAGATKAKPALQPSPAVTPPAAPVVVPPAV